MKITYDGGGCSIQTNVYTTYVGGVLVYINTGIKSASLVQPDDDWLCYKHSSCIRICYNVGDMLQVLGCN